MNDASAPDGREAAPPPVPFLPLDTFLVPGHDFLVSAMQDVYVMAAAHTHSQVELNYFLDGDVTYRLGGRDAAFGTGDLVLFWGANPHQTVEVAPGTRYVCIYLPLAMFLKAELSGALRSAVLAGGIVVADDPSRFPAGRMQGLVEDARRGPDARMADLIAADVMLLLRRLDVTGWRDVLAGTHAAGRASAGVLPAAVVEMTRFIAEHGHEAIGIADVARAANLHPNYAMTRFRVALGLTIAEAILRHRLMAAQTLLMSTKKDVAAIAFETGFGSVSQFHRSFRAHFALTPAAFRRRLNATPRTIEA